MLRGNKSSKIKAITMLTNDSLQFLGDLKQQQSRLVFRKQKKDTNFLKDYQQLVAGLLVIMKPLDLALKC
jgi:hypothetical protein